MRRLAHSAPRLDFAVLVSLMAGGSSHEVRADDPALTFDFGRALECRDVTPIEYAELYPDERIVEATLRLSVHLTGGAINDVAEIRVEIVDGDSRLLVH